MLDKNEAALKLKAFQWAQIAELQYYQATVLKFEWCHNHFTVSQSQSVLVQNWILSKHLLDVWMSNDCAV